MSVITETLDTINSNNIVSEILDWLQDKGIQLAFYALIVYLARHFGGVIIRKIIMNALRRDKFTTKRDEQQREDTLVGILTTIMNVAIWILAGLAIMNVLGVNISAMLAGAGALGLVVGLGAQSLIGDFLAGMFIIIENQYRIGDIVEVNGKTGVVEAISIRTTILRDLDGNQHHIPNGSITNSTNMSKDFSNMHITIGVSYDSDIDEVEKVINKIGADMVRTKKWGEKIIDAPKFIRVNNFNDSSVDIKVLARVQPGTQWATAGEFRRRLKKSFEENSIEIPYPHIVVKK